jgi:hypothetical protein
MVDDEEEVEERGKAVLNSLRASGGNRFCILNVVANSRTYICKGSKKVRRHAPQQARNEYQTYTQQNKLLNLTYKQSRK